jgi:barstar (barnase inhibitor)
MELNRGPTIITLAQADEVRAEAERTGIPLYIISTGARSGCAAFFDAVRASLPLDPPVMSSCNWDALSDSLWQGLYDLGVPRVVIMWPDSAPFRAETPQDFDIALAVLADVAEVLADQRATVGKPVEVGVYVGEPGQEE